MKKNTTYEKMDEELERAWNLHIKAMLALDNMRYLLEALQKKSPKAFTPPEEIAEDIRMGFRMENF